MIRVIPPPSDYGVTTENWQAVVDELNAEGLDARLEETSAWHSLGDVAAHVGVFLSVPVTQPTLEIIAGVLLAKLRGKRPFGYGKAKSRRVPIYGPRGEVLRVVEVPFEDGEEGNSVN